MSLRTHCRLLPLQYCNEERLFVGKRMKTAAAAVASLSEAGKYLERERGEKRSGTQSELRTSFFTGSDFLIKCSDVLLVCVCTRMREDSLENIFRRQTKIEGARCLGVGREPISKFVHK